MDVDPAPVPRREVEHSVHLREAELGGRLVVRDAAETVDAELDRTLEQSLVSRVGEEAVLRERRDLDGDELGKLVAHPE